jgi:hypothetical protein
MLHRKITIPIAVEYIELPVVLRPRSMKAYSKNPDTAKFEFEEKPKSPRNGPFDPWNLRQDFLSWPLEEWKEFVLKTGRLGIHEINKDEFGRLQRVVKEALIRPAREWKTLELEFGVSIQNWTINIPKRINFDWDSEVPRACIKTFNTLDAIFATIQVDKLQGAQFRECARHDCKNPPFRVEARHKIFCSPECAHLAAVRESRKRAAEAKAKAAKKSAKRK